MATSSILKDVNIREQRLAHTFVKALDDAKNTKFKDTKISRSCSEITGDIIKDFFGKR